MHTRFDAFENHGTRMGNRSVQVDLLRTPRWAEATCNALLWMGGSMRPIRVAKHMMAFEAPELWLAKWGNTTRIMRCLLQ